MKILKISIIALIVISLLSFNLNLWIKKIEYKKNSTNVFNCYFDSVEIDTGQYTIKVIGCYIDDSVFSGRHYYNQIPVNQVLYILKKDSVLFSMPHPATYEIDKTVSGRSIPLMEHRITEIGIIGKGDKMLFEVIGFSGSNSIEFLQLFDTKGNMVLYSYYNKAKNISEGKGILLDVLKEHNIEYDSTFRTQNFFKVKINPKPPYLKKK